MGAAPEERVPNPTVKSVVGDIKVGDIDGDIKVSMLKSGTGSSYESKSLFTKLNLNPLRWEKNAYLTV